MTFLHQSSAIFWHAGEAAAWTSKAVAAADVPQVGAHVWFIGNANYDDLKGLVSEAELKRAHEMLPASKAHEFLCARATLRQLLAVYIQTLPPREICIAITEQGKPYLPDHPALKFNLSHSHGALAIAISYLDVGIDIEKIRPVPDWRELARDLLAATEAATIAGLCEAERGPAFLRGFTAREAYLKANGTGFSGNLPALDFLSSSAESVMPDLRDRALMPLPPVRGIVGHLCLLRAA